MLKKLFYQLIPIAFLFAISVVYFYPSLEGKDIVSHDKETIEVSNSFYEKNKTSLWNDVVFSGMPVFVSTYLVKENIFLRLNIIMRKVFPRTVILLFLLFLCFYLAMKILSFDSMISFIGALAFGLCTWLLLSIEASHNTKIASIAYAIPMLASVIKTYRGEFIKGAVYTSFFLAMMIASFHIQIMYYSIYVIIPIIIYFFIVSKTNNNLKKFFKASFILLPFVILAMFTQSTRLLVIKDYSNQSIRGGVSEINQEDNNLKESVNKTSSKGLGLDYDYATSWSYGLGESINLIIPGAYGGGAELDKNSATALKLGSLGVPKASVKNYLKGIPVYYGNQPFTSGPFYVGVINFFLFVLMFAISRNPFRWVLLTVAIMSFLFGLGGNFELLSKLCFNYIPLFNRFRVPSMWLIISHLCFAWGSVITLKELSVLNKASFGEVTKKILKVGMAFGGFFLLLLLFSGSLIDFSGANDEQLAKNGFPIAALIEDRKSLLYSDIFRSLFFLLAAFGLIWFWLKGKLKNIKILFLALATLILIDLWTVNKRYVNNDDFVSVKRKNKIQPTSADLEILKDTSKFRVFNATESAFNEIKTSYFHKSIGGYSAAKLRIYQDLIEHQLSKFKRPSLNMLNTKYIIMDTKEGPVSNYNKDHCGNAWFVDDIKFVKTATEEMNFLDDFNPKKQVVIRESFKPYFNNYSLTALAEATPNSSITITEYKPDNIKYQASSEKDKLAVFSEVWYKGNLDWKAYIDGKETEFIKVNYLLRGLIVPKGNHTIEFKFYPIIHFKTLPVTLVSSIILLVLLLLVIVYDLRKKIGKILKN